MERINTPRVAANPALYYRRFFPNNPPCRTTLHAPAPKGFLVEIEAIAVDRGGR